eukprot:5331202-Lingulodinium_polyedra.AAC.1
MKGAWQSAAGRPIAKGCEIEVPPGHYVAGAFFRRELLSIPRAMYAFCRDCYNVPTRFWASVAVEAAIIGDLCVLSE